jgi:hypothetical protein
VALARRASFPEPALAVIALAARADRRAHVRGALL